MAEGSSFIEKFLGFCYFSNSVYWELIVKRNPIDLFSTDVLLKKMLELKIQQRLCIYWERKECTLYSSKYEHLLVQNSKSKNDFRFLNFY